MYCVKCRKQTDTSNEMENKDTRGRDRIKGNCNICGTMKYKYVRQKTGGDIVSAIGKLNPPEMHLYSTNQRR